MSQEPTFDSILRVTDDEGDWFEMIVDSWHIGQKADLTWVRSYQGVICRANEAYVHEKGERTDVQFPSQEYVIVCVAF